MSWPEAPTFLYSCPESEGKAWQALLRPHFPQMDFRVYPSDIGNKENIDIALVWRPEPGLLKSLPNLKLIYNLGAGAETLLEDGTTPQDIPIFRLIDPALTLGMTEYVVHWALHFHRGFHDFKNLETKKDWQEIRYPMAHERRIGVLGLGQLGGHAARRLASMDFCVAGWAQTQKELHQVEVFIGERGFKPFLQRTDILVNLLPLTPQTEDIINAENLASLPQGAFVINAARGGHVVEDDLLKAVDSGHIAGAALDVFHTEPLPTDHPFWEHPRIIVTPHIASLTQPKSAAKVAVNNIKTFMTGEMPDCLVDWDVGY